MKQKKALVKLAQVRLAINHVLRQRMVKKADSGPQYGKMDPPIGVDVRPFGTWDATLPDEGKFIPGQPYRPLGWKGDIDTNNPTYQGAMFGDAIGPLWNKGLNMYSNFRNKQHNAWNKRYHDFLNNQDLLSAFGNPAKVQQLRNENDDWHRKNPEPEEYRLPEQLYMTTPYKINGRTYEYPSSPITIR